MRQIIYQYHIIIVELITNAHVNLENFDSAMLCVTPVTPVTPALQLNRANNEIEEKTHSTEEACPKRKLYLITASKHKKR